MKVKNIMFFANGNSTVFDENGEQIGELQKSWFKLFIKHLDENNADYDEAEILMPDGKKAEIIRFVNDWNWSIK